MKLHGIMVTKNEADVIDYTLRSAAQWADRVYVLDTGSTDDTWARVQEQARRFPAIVPFKSENLSFNDWRRGEVFNAFRHEAGPDSWWCRLDSDEIYLDDPRAFLAAVPRRHHVVWSAHFQYYFTREDLARCPPTPQERPTIDETNRPRYYLNNASEPRFFRHRAGLQWTQGAWPRHLGVVHPRRIRVRHFQYRSPQQIQLRLNTRHLAAKAGYAFRHNPETHWEEKLRNAADLHLDDGRSPLQLDEAAMPHHLEPRGQRWLKLLLHGAGIWP
jgi:glycosyltransferase involved in cell wall biosynthesis